GRRRPVRGAPQRRGPVLALAGRPGGARRLAPGGQGGHPAGVLGLRGRGLDRHAAAQPARADGRRAQLL
ncbi:MAG: MbtH-like NRPS chaperone, partial [uncultured Corynebacteriales bacterium]